MNGWGGIEVGGAAVWELSNWHTLLHSGACLTLYNTTFGGYDMIKVAHLIIPPQAPDGAPPDVWSQLLSCCEACAAQATQQPMGAPAAAFEAEQQQ